jgi:protein arginine N-methyltransferase 1
LKNKVTLSTSPYEAYTHWKNVIFYLDKPQKVEKGDAFQGSIAVRQSKENYRELDIKFSYHFKTDPTLNPAVAPYTQLYKVR